MSQPVVNNNNKREWLLDERFLFSFHRNHLLNVKQLLSFIEERRKAQDVSRRPQWHDDREGALRRALSGYFSLRLRMETGAKWILLPLFSLLVVFSILHFAHSLQGPDHTRGVMTPECSEDCQRTEEHDLKSESERLRDFHGSQMSQGQSWEWAEGQVCLMPSDLRPWGAKGTPFPDHLLYAGL